MVLLVLIIVSIEIFLLNLLIKLFFANLCNKQIINIHFADAEIFFLDVMAIE